MKIEPQQSPINAPPVSLSGFGLVRFSTHRSEAKQGAESKPDIIGSSMSLEEEDIKSNDIEVSSFKERKGKLAKEVV